MSLETGTRLTNTPLTDNYASNWKKIAVNTLVNAAAGALVGRYVCNQTWQQGAFLGATVTLATATIGAWVKDNISYLHNDRYAQTIGILGAAFVLTYLKQANLPNFRMNVIHAAAILALATTVTQALSDLSLRKLKI